MNEQKEDAAKVALAQAIKKIMSNWAYELEIIGMKTKICRARYLALRREGFDVSEALPLCLKNVEL